jgi:hypothetical protein
MLIMMWFRDLVSNDVVARARLGRRLAQIEPPFEGL